MSQGEQKKSQAKGSGHSRYSTVGEIGRGGMGAIQEALDPSIGRRVAVKVLGEQHQADPEALHAFYEEARITGQIDHPNVVPVYDLGSGSAGPYMVMKLVNGSSLLEQLEERRQQRGAGEAAPDAPELRRYVQILLKLCDALSLAHVRGVVHCDLKPENIMVGAHGEVYLMDWGVAVVRDSEHEMASDSEYGERAGFRGTPAYMAPEQLLAQLDEIDCRTDVFGLGGVLYAILFGEGPNAQAELISRAVAGKPVSLPETSALWGRLPPGLCQIAIQALSPDKQDRYQSISEMQVALEQFLLGGGWFGTRYFKDGEVIIHEGSEGDVAYIIESGYCDIYKRGEGSDAVRVRRLEPGDAFGETAVLTGAPRTASVVAVGDVSLKEISAESLNQELDRNPWLAAFVRSLARLFREADATLSDAQRMSLVPPELPKK